MSALIDTTGQRVALITGGARGIGRAIAIRLAQDGLDIVLNDIPSKSILLDTVVKEIESVAKGRKALAIPCDVTKEVEVRAMVNKAVEVFGRLDVMVANAGIGQPPSPIMDAKVEEWENLFAVNIRGVLLCYKYAALQMVKQGAGGRIIGASSGAGKKGFAGFGSYCVSKSAVRALTQTAALELGEHGITVNAYAPGVIQTELTTTSKDEALGGPCALVKQLYKIPDAKVAQPDVVASLVSYLAKPEAHFITGQTISVDGGLLFS